MLKKNKEELRRKLLASAEDGIDFIVNSVDSISSINECNSPLVDPIDPQKMGKEALEQFEKMLSCGEGENDSTLPDKEYRSPLLDPINPRKLGKEALAQFEKVMSCGGGEKDVVDLDIIYGDDDGILSCGNDDATDAIAGCTGTTATASRNGLDLLQCCHPNATSQDFCCWSYFAGLFQKQPSLVLDRLEADAEDRDSAPSSPGQQKPLVVTKRLSQDSTSSNPSSKGSNDPETKVEKAPNNIVTVPELPSLAVEEQTSNKSSNNDTSQQENKVKKASRVTVPELPSLAVKVQAIINSSGSNNNDQHTKAKKASTVLMPGIPSLAMKKQANNKSIHNQQPKEIAIDKQEVLPPFAIKGEANNKSRRKVGSSNKQPEIPVVTVQALSSFTVEERDTISKIIQCLMHRYNDDDRNHGSTINTIMNNPAEKSLYSLGSDRNSDDSFLLELATTAANIALDIKRSRGGASTPSSQSVLRSLSVTSDDGDINAGDDGGDDDPSVAIQKLLQAAKQDENLLKSHQHHIERVQLLVKKYPSLLHPLDPCWKAMEISLRANHINNHQDPRVLNNLLGRNDDRATLRFLWEIVEESSPQIYQNERKLYNLLRLCFHCAVVHAFLTTHDDNSCAKVKTLEVAIAELVCPEKNADPAIQSMLDNFLEFQKEQQMIDVETVKAANLIQKTKMDDDITSSTSALRECFLKWHNNQVPNLLSSLSLCMNELLLPTLDIHENAANSNSQHSHLGWLLPNLDHDERSDNILFGSVKGGCLSSWLYTIACTVPPHIHTKIGPTWPRLYSTHSEGFNLSTLEHSLTGYHGPTLLLVEAFDKRTKKGHLFGAMASQPWSKQSSADFYGDSDSFLFQIKPTFKVFRAKESLSSIAEQPPGIGSHNRRPVPPNYQYFYFDRRASPPTISKNGDGKSAPGIGLGGTPRRPRFFVSACLDACHFGTSDATFESDNDDSYYTGPDRLWDLLSVEVWGVGGETALRALSRHQIMKDSHVQKARQVEKAAFLNDFRSGLIESKMFGFHEEIRNRDGGCLLDCNDEEDEDGKWQIGAPRRGTKK